MGTDETSAIYSPTPRRSTSARALNAKEGTMSDNRQNCLPLVLICLRERIKAKGKSCLVGGTGAAQMLATHKAGRNGVHTTHVLLLAKAGKREGRAVMPLGHPWWQRRAERPHEPGSRVQAEMLAEVVQQPSLNPIFGVLQRYDRLILEVPARLGGDRLSPPPHREMPK